MKIYDENFIDIIYKILKERDASFIGELTKDEIELFGNLITDRANSYETNPNMSRFKFSRVHTSSEFHMGY